MKKIFFILMIILSSIYIYAMEENECLIGNCTNGLCAFNFDDDSIYIGECRDKIPNGLGIRFFSNDTQEMGLFEEGYFTGNDTENIAFKKKYEIKFNKDRTLFHVGQFKNDSPNGEGIQRNSKGLITVGFFQNGLPEGKCSYYDSNDESSATFIGEMKKGERSKGIIIIKTTNDGVEAISTYTGQWVNDSLNGKGKDTYICGDESRVYEGNYVDGKRHGKGIITLSNGDKYIGEFINDGINGRGTYIFSNGTKYVGGFKDGKYHGLGTLYNPDGSVEYKGRWIENNLVEE